MCSGGMYYSMEEWSILNGSQVKRKPQKATKTISITWLPLLPGRKKGNTDDAMQGDPVQLALEDLSKDIFQIVWDLLVGFFSRIICSDQRE